MLKPFAIWYYGFSDAVASSGTLSVGFCRAIFMIVNHAALTSRNARMTGIQSDQANRVFLVGEVIGLQFLLFEQASVRADEFSFAGHDRIPLGADQGKRDREVSIVTGSGH